MDTLRLISVYIEPSSLRPEIQSASSNGQQIVINDVLQMLSISNNSQSSDSNFPYFKFPESYLGNQLKSYGGYIKYTVRHEGYGDPILFTPDIILIVRNYIYNLYNLFNNFTSLFYQGNGVKLMYFASEVPANSDTVVSARLFADVWQKENTGSSDSNKLATREEVMMVLANVENILIR